MRRLILAVCVFLLLGVSACAEGFQNGRVQINLSGQIAFYPFTVDKTGLYDVVAMGGRGNVSDIKIISGGKNVSPTGAYLEKGRNYSMCVNGTGRVNFRIYPHTMGCSPCLPIETDGTGSGIIARDDAAGWFSFTAEKGFNVMEISSSDELKAAACVYDEDLKPVSSSYTTKNGCLLLSFEAENRNYLLRVDSRESTKGMYSFELKYAGETRTEKLLLRHDKIELFEGDMRALDAGTAYALWESDDENVVSVNGNIITAIGEGETYVSAYSYGALTGGIHITVERREPTDIFYYSDETYIPLYETAAPRLIIYPSSASRDMLTFSSDDESIVKVNENGEITAVGMGETFVRCVYGELSAATYVTVTEAKDVMRCVIIGEENYGDETETREGTVLTVNSLVSLFESAEFSDGRLVNVSSYTDLSGSEVLETIKTAFGDAKKDDISLLYITCHGIKSGDDISMRFTDGAQVSPDELYDALKDVDGSVILFIDCCGSGAFINGFDDFAAGFEKSFSNSGFMSSKYRLLLSASVGQESYRIGNRTDGKIATVFARALCDALGYSVENQSRAALGADRDFDGKITLNETYLYVKRRVMWYLNSIGGGEYVQQVRVWPEGDPFVLFER